MFNTNNLIKDIRKKFDEKDILINEPMSKHTTFKIGGNADIFVKADTIEKIIYILKLSKDNSIPLFIIGNGSNILVKDEGIRGIVLKIELNDVNIIEEDNKIKVTVGAGVKLAQLAQILLKNSIKGFEFASGIPGTIGGAVRMNAGAYGTEMKDIVYKTTFLDYDGNLHTILNNEHNFEYRKKHHIRNDTSFRKRKFRRNKKKNGRIFYTKKRKTTNWCSKCGKYFQKR